MIPVEVERGESPIILGFPHAGTDLPAPVRERLNDNGRLLADTDWHIDTLYGKLTTARASRVRATFHRYVVDANRDPKGSSLYPGQNTTALIPTTDFDGKRIWRVGHEPTEMDTAARLAEFHASYHAALANEIERVKAVHGVAVLYDSHSIRSHIPFLFDGKLPDFNVGTDGGRTCAPLIEQTAIWCARASVGYTSVLNGRFKGGWTTRHYGRPETGVHAIQMELAQSIYISSEAPPFAYDSSKAKPVCEHLRSILEAIEAVALSLDARKART